MDKDDLKFEYKDASENIRHFQTVRFAQLTIYIAVTAGIMNFLFLRASPQPMLAAIISKSAGLLITLLFWMLHERTMLYWRHFMKRAVQIEEELGFQQYTSRPPARLATGTNAIRWFYVVLGVFWVAALIWFP